VVVRYFGGVKLGVGGLIIAYKTAAEEALKNALIVEREVYDFFHLEYTYTATPEVMRLVKDFELKIIQQDFSDQGKMDIEIPLRLKEQFMEKVTLLKALNVELNIQPRTESLG
jgi:putative IMPACT (imprinted ancient) family translation regulator